MIGDLSATEMWQALDARAHQFMVDHGLNEYDAAHRGLSPPGPESLPTELRDPLRSVLTLFPLPLAPELVSTLQGLAATAPPAASGRVGDYLVWAEMVRDDMRRRLTNKGRNLNAFDEFRAGGDPDFDLGPDVETFHEFAVLTMTDAYIAGLRGSEHVKRWMEEQVQVMFRAAEQLGLAPRPLRIDGSPPSDRIVSLFTVALVRARTSLTGVAGTRLRRALELRHGSGSADRALVEELPGAVVSARAEVGDRAAHQEQTPETIRRLLGEVRSATEKEVIAAQGVDMKDEGVPWTVNLESFDEHRRDQSVAPDAVTLARFELRELNARARRELTKRQLEVYEQIGRGLTPAEAAAELGIDARSVRQHLHGLRRRLRSGRQVQRP